MVDLLSNPGFDTHIRRIEEQVKNSFYLYEQKNIPVLQEQLNELYNNFNKQGGGRLITNYPRKEQLTACFTFMLAYDGVCYCFNHEDCG